MFADVPQDEPLVEAEPGFEGEVSAYNLFAYLSRSDVTWNPSVCSVLEDSLYCPTTEEFILPIEHGNDRVEWFMQLSDEITWDVKDKETGKPRAKVTMRAGDIAAHSAFLSFGTNDLTQMTYGLSRDDAGRFMGTYVGQGVYAEDPFHVLDQDGVGELLLTGAQRGRAQRPDITISVCGEHGGNPESIQFCHQAGFDYVSCSPFRVPVARLASGQSAIRSAETGNR